MSINQLVEQFKTAKERHQDKITKIAAQIENDKAELSAAKAEYEQLLLSGNDKKADQLFDRIYDLKRNIEKNESKHKTLNSGRLTDEMKAIADKIEAAGEKEKQKFHEILQAKNKEIEDLKEQYFLKLEEIGAVMREQRELNQKVLNAEKMINPGMEPYWLPSIDYQTYQYTIDNKSLIYQAMAGTRQKGVTR